MSSSSLPHPSTRKQAQSEAGGAPQWLVELGVGPGEFYQTSKAQPRRIMRDSAWSEKARAWACLSLHTMAFQEEMAVKLVKGQRVPLTRGDIAAETGLTPAQVRRSLVSLELEGYAERQGGDGGLRKGEITIHCWAIPRPEKQLPEASEDSRPVLEVPEDLPLYLQRWIRKLGLERLPAPEVLQKCGALCKTISEKEAELKHLLKPDSEAQPRTPAKTVRGTNLTPFGVRGRLPHIRMKDSDRKKEGAAAAALEVLGEKAAAALPTFPLTKQAIQAHDSGVDGQFIERLIRKSNEAASAAEIPLHLVNDRTVSKAVEESFRTYHGRTPHGSGLLLLRVPEIICAWAKQPG